MSLSPAATDQIEKYTGGFFQTNAYALPTPSGGRLLIDAPEGVASWVRSRGWKIDALLLTHAHIDHIQDAAAVVREHGCPLYYHADGVPLLIDTSAYRRFGLSVDFEPVTGGEFITASPGAEFAGRRFEVLHVPAIAPAACASTTPRPGGCSRATCSSPEPSAARTCPAATRTCSCAASTTSSCRCPTT